MRRSEVNETEVWHFSSIWQLGQSTLLTWSGTDKEVSQYSNIFNNF